MVAKRSDYTAEAVEAARSVFIVPFLVMKAMALAGRLKERLWKPII
jgi:hypothetical protein